MRVRFTYTVANHQTETHFAFVMENVKQQIRAQILGGKFLLQLRKQLRLHMRGEQSEIRRGCSAAHRSRLVFFPQIQANSVLLQTIPVELLDPGVRRNLRFNE